MPPRKRKESKIISTIKTIKDLAEWLAFLLGLAQGLEWLIETIKRLLT
ncbi:MAG: hypothetical protein HDT50_02580 [Lactobacillus sp.]|nr:hypothetical protein [Lactobacillus sp.]